MATVLWGARVGDVQYAGIDWRRRNIPIGVLRIAVSNTLVFDVGDVCSMGRIRDRDVLWRIAGIEALAGEIGVDAISALEVIANLRPLQSQVRGQLS